MLTQVAVAVFRIASLAIPSWIALRIGLARSRGAEKVSFSLAREATLFAAVSYLVVLLAVTIYPLPVTRRPVDPGTGVNVMPMVASLRCLTSSPGDPPEARRFCVENIAGNIALFLPLGALVLLLCRRRPELGGVALIALAVSSLIEMTQYAERGLGWFRSVDVDDIVFNVTGAAVGFLVLARIRPRRPAERE